MKKWSNDEIVFLKENYPKKGCKYVCEKLNRNRGSVQKKAYEFDLRVDTSALYISKEKLKEIVKESMSYKDVIIKLGKSISGKQYEIIKKYINKYSIDTSHFDPYHKNSLNLEKGRKSYPIEYWLKYGSNIGSSKLKEKLYKENLKDRKCEKCDQGEMWNGEKMSLILDHINGDPKDNKLGNLRILCPNCNATLPTHCRGHKKITN